MSPKSKCISKLKQSWQEEKTGKTNESRSTIQMLKIRGREKDTSPDAHCTLSVKRIKAPKEFSLWLS